MALFEAMFIQDQDVVLFFLSVIFSQKCLKNIRGYMQKTIIMGVLIFLTAQSSLGMYGGKGDYGSREHETMEVYTCPQGYQECIRYNVSIYHSCPHRDAEIAQWKREREADRIARKKAKEDKKKAKAAKKAQKVVR